MRNGVLAGVSTHLTLGSPRRSNVFAGAAAAYSTRIPAGSTYNGPLLRVRRSSDNTEADFGVISQPDANGNRFLDTTALLAFCGAGSGFVTTWYDQSGNSGNATQITPSRQAQIVTAGVLTTQNGKPSLRYSGAQYYRAVLTSLNSATPHTLSSVGQGAGNLVALSSTQAPDQNSCLGAGLTVIGATGPWFGGYGQDGPFIGSPSIATFSVVTKVYTPGSSIVGYGNGTIYFSNLGAPTYSLTTADIMLGVQCNGIYVFLTGYQGEAVVFTSALSTASRQALERSQGAAFGITVA